MMKMREFLYLFEFIKNIFKYHNKKINTQKLQIWVGQTCTLKCKNCSQLFPYIEPKIYNINDVIEDLKYSLKYIKPESIHIIGGEPFTNKDIGKLISYICEVNPNKPNKIVSNGTIIPKNEILELLTINKQSMSVTISDYPVVKEKQEQCYKIMQEKNIDVKYVIKDDSWYYMGDNNEKEIKGYNVLKRNFKLCWDKTCITISEGILTLCPRMHNSHLVFLDEKYMYIEHIPIRRIPNNFIGRALVATCLTTKTYRESCRHCWGLSNASGKIVEKAQQIERV